MGENRNLIREKLNKYSQTKSKLENYQAELQENHGSSQEERKITEGQNNKLLELNRRRNELKKIISDLKKEIKIQKKEIEEVCYANVTIDYQGEFDDILSEVNDKNTKIKVYKLGDDFDPVICNVHEVITSRDKNQDKKVLKMLDYGIVIEGEDEITIEKKALVDVCLYNKKIQAGSLIPYNENDFQEKKGWLKFRF